MSYLIKQKFSIAELVDLDQPRKRILIGEPQGDLGALYRGYLNEHFDTQHCTDLALLKQELRRFSPQLLIVNSGSLLGLAGLKAASLKTEFPSLLIVTIGQNLDSESLKELMATGVCSHINRSLTRPQDVVEVVKALLINN